MKKALIILGFLAALVLLVAAGAGVWAYNEFLHTEPLTEAELAELTPDWDEVTGGNWSPWYTRADGTTEWNPAASYNAWLARVPEEDKAWPVLVEVYFEHYESVFRSDTFVNFAGTLPHHPRRWERYRESLESEAVDDLTAGLEKAASRSVMGCDLLNSTDPYEHAALLAHGLEDAQWRPNPPENLPMMDVQLPWLGRARSVTHILQGRAALALEEGDPASFVRLIEAIEATSDLNSDLPILIGQLVELAIDAVNQETIAWALAAHQDQFEEVHLARLADVLRRQSETEFRWPGERLAFHDAVRRMADEQGTIAAQKFADGNFLGGEPVSIPVYQLHPSAQRMLLVQQNMLERGIVLGEIPWNQDIATAESVLQDQRTELNALADKVLDILIPVFDKAVDRVRMFRQQSIGLQIAVAAYRHRLRHGDFPASLDAFEADLLSTEPVDAFTGEPLKYTLTDTGPLIYSVGDDRVDDGGQIRWGTEETDSGEERRKRTWPQWYTSQEAARLLRKNPEAIKGDWVLFPIPVGDPEPLVEEQDPGGDLKQGGNFDRESGAVNPPEGDG